MLNYRTNYKEILSDLRISNILVEERKQLIEHIGINGVIKAIISVTDNNYMICNHGIYGNNMLTIGRDKNDYPQGYWDNIEKYYT